MIIFDGSFDVQVGSLSSIIDGSFSEKPLIFCSDFLTLMDQTIEMSILICCLAIILFKHFS